MESPANDVEEMKEDPPPKKEDALDIVDICKGDRGVYADTDCFLCGREIFTKDRYLTCSTCQRSFHPVCMEFTDVMYATVKRYQWQCENCKGCSKCSYAVDEDSMLLCDGCDRGFHTYCIGVAEVPEGDWFCSVHCATRERTAVDADGVSSSTARRETKAKKPKALVLPSELADVASRYVVKLNEFDLTSGATTIEALVQLLASLQDARRSLRQYKELPLSGATDVPLSIYDVTCEAFSEIAEHEKCAVVHERMLLAGGLLSDEVLSHAVKAGNIGRVDALFTSLSNEGKFVDVENADGKGLTLLMHCAFKRCSSAHEFCAIAERLLAHGANVNATTVSGYTALMIAAHMAHFCVLSKLIIAGARLNATTKDGDSALTLVAKRPNDAILAKIVNLLLLTGADAAYEKGRRRETVVEVAKKHGNEQIAALVEDYSQKYI